jgi:hypothetical protein
MGLDGRTVEDATETWEDKMEKNADLETQRIQNQAAMDERIARIGAYMASGDYPMTPDNPLLGATDDEVRAYIRKRRAEFEERHKR